MMIGHSLKAIEACPKSFETHVPTIDSQVNVIDRFLKYFTLESIINEEEENEEATLVSEDDIKQMKTKLEEQVTQIKAKFKSDEAKNIEAHLSLIQKELESISYTFLKGDTRSVNLSGFLEEKGTKFNLQAYRKALYKPLQIFMHQEEQEKGRVQSKMCQSKNDEERSVADVTSAIGRDYKGKPKVETPEKETPPKEEDPNSEQEKIKQNSGLI